MSDELTSIIGAGGGGVTLGMLVVRLFDRFLKKSDSEIGRLEKRLDVMQAEQAAHNAKMLERVNESLNDHKDRLRELEHLVSFLRGRDEGYKLGLRAGLESKVGGA